MKKNIITAFVALSLLAGFAGISTAATTCTEMSVEYIGEEAIILKNRTGSPCGATPVNGNVDAVYTAEIADRTLAIALTALSLDKYVWANYTLSPSGNVINNLSVRRN
jgi:hypothetical protein